ncbi:hypothetical protein CLAVI_000481 [Candidatus Clavichlamydia salmonicola]|uniref:hypothetical protein n=1 Tax=Candidatus Clavichlamydia salmonicola TaxID=469812 RepID=UPI001891EA0A|nr:hypothetical protein [Candidatus Clavichlamydia salmonicola]MBF5050859.1 hypothetical protein [Candidatus Clavichlamydia salmonicola]
MSNVQPPGSHPSEYPSEEVLHFVDAAQEAQVIGAEYLSLEVQNQDDLYAPLSTALFGVSDHPIQSDEVTSVRHEELMQMGRITTSKLLASEKTGSVPENVTDKEGALASIEESKIIPQDGKMASLKGEITPEKLPFVAQTSAQIADSTDINCPKDIKMADPIQDVEVKVASKESLLEDFFDVPVEELAWMLAPELERKEQEKRNRASSLRSSYSHLNKKEEDKLGSVLIDILENEQGKEDQEEEPKEEEISLDPLNQKVQDTAHNQIPTEDFNFLKKEEIQLKKSLVIPKGDGVKAVPDFLLKQERFYPFRSVSGNSYKVNEVLPVETVDNDLLNKETRMNQLQVKEKNKHLKYS